MAAHTNNAIEIAAPRDYVWERMMDIPGWTDLFTEYAGAEVIEQDGNHIKFRLTTHPDPDYDGQVWSWVSEREADPENYKSESKRIETGPFEYMTIKWSFEETDSGGTLMRWIQDFSMKPSAPADDEHAQEYMNKNTKVQMAAIKDKLEAQAPEGG